MVPCILPWDIAEATFKCGAFRRAFFEDVDSCHRQCARYWIEATKCEWGLLHPLSSQSAEDWQFQIPVFWHLDDVQMAETSGAPVAHTVVSWSSSLTTGSTGLTKHVFLTFPRDDTVPRKTMAALAEVIAWVMTAMQTGRRPAADPAGIPMQSPAEEFAPPWCFSMSGLKHDLEARVKAHVDCKTYNHNYVCMHCSAHKHMQCLYMGDLRENAYFAKTIIGDTDHVRLYNVSPWLKVPGFAYSRALYDQMHLLYHNGFISDFVSSCLIDLLHHEQVLGADLDDALDEMTSKFLKWRSEQRRYPNDSRHDFARLTRLRIKWKGDHAFPELTMCYKCGTVRLFMYFLNDFLTEHVPGGTRYQQVRALCAWSFSKYMEVLRNGRAVLSPDEQAEAVKHGQTFLNQYVVLHQHCKLLRRKLWKIRPKAHYEWHVIDGLRSSAMNPRYGECWLEESLLGQVCKTFSRCHGATRMAAGLHRHIRFLIDIWYREESQAECWLAN